MHRDVYELLADHLDKTPAGLPRTDSGVEISILKRLFNPEEAELALHLELLEEEPRVVARRAGLPVEKTALMLERMADNGSIYRIEGKDGRVRYMLAQLAVGMWEWQLERLTPGLIEEMNDYFPKFIQHKYWDKSPQMRVIPVGRSVTPELETLPYEDAAELVCRQEVFLVAECICRREHAMQGKPCDKPGEICLIFGAIAKFYHRNGLGRLITKKECLELLRQADKAGLVLQPNNSQSLSWICCCCGCCCQLLKSMQRAACPSDLVSSPYVAAYDPAKCIDCGICLDRCQMAAFSRDDEDNLFYHPERCIGCGLCVTTCKPGALSLKRKPDNRQKPVPKHLGKAMYDLGRARGVMGPAQVINLLMRSGKDRLLSKLM